VDAGTVTIFEMRGLSVAERKKASITKRLLELGIRAVLTVAGEDRTSWLETALLTAGKETCVVDCGVHINSRDDCSRISVEESLGTVFVTPINVE